MTNKQFKEQSLTSAFFENSKGKYIDQYENERIVIEEELEERTPTQKESLEDQPIGFENKVLKDLEKADRALAI